MDVTLIFENGSETLITGLRSVQISNNRDIITCSYCEKKGHNVRTCTKIRQDNP